MAPRRIRRRPIREATSCASCLAWGSMYCRGLCRSCYRFAAKYKTIAECRGCFRREPVKGGYCRLCWCQAHHDRSLTATDARSRVVLAPYLARIGHHQLFFADMTLKGIPEPRRFPRRYGAKGRPPKPPPAPATRPIGRWLQPPLFEAVDRDYRRRRFNLVQAPPPDNPWLAWALYLAHGIAEGRGWKPNAWQAMQRTLVRLLAGHTDGEAIRITDVRRVTAQHYASIDNAIEILDAMGVLTDDRPRTFDLWLQAKLAQLPQGLAGPVSDWARTLHHGGPRSRPRDQATTTQYVRAILPALCDWATRCDHLREVTRDDILAQLAAMCGHQRATSVSALRSLFTWAKRTKVVFRNPAARLRFPRLEDPILQPLTPDELACTVEAATTPHARLFVALAGIHAARPAQIRALRINDVDLGNRRITIAGRERPLDDLTYRVLRAWLDHRRQRWPNTANPHLIISYQTALGLGPVSHALLAPAMRGLPATIECLRMDRQLEEAIAAGGDPLHLAAVFGISDATALRWAANARALLAKPPGKS